MSENKSFSIDHCIVQNVPPTAYYIPNYISEKEETSLITNIYSAPKPKWTQLSNRRLQNWGGIPHTNGMIAETIPSWLDDYLDKIHALNVMDGKRPNHVLVNEYQPGQGIMPHLDGSLFHPTITTLSIGSHIVLKFVETSSEEDIKTSNHVFSLLLEPRSLLILQDQLFSYYLHCIDDITDDVLDDTVANLNMCSGPYVRGSVARRDTRLSLTIRHVPKTTSFKLNIGNKR
ncbi:alpha-ketoglutarate-dependent dioxygenase alkB homolog 6 [Plodia interpunctella]|uniref:alpha-ketoglutarate-dependent dioxygenase alkB homolog 6 n=1 Tax=Plodia interpunctella TaxID=58824 RepID=UPI002367DC1A|nr:alpha-ketoglutarate-dependent dioxygenase alkB homolog 6 [Plodia interpunctella]